MRSVSAHKRAQPQVERAAGRCTERALDARNVMEQITEGEQTVENQGVEKPRQAADLPSWR